MTADWLRWVVLLVTLLLMIRGAFRGFSGELAPLLGLVAGTATAWFGYPWIRALLDLKCTEMQEGELLFYASLTIAVLAFVIYMVVSLITRRFFSWILPQPLNAIFGIAVGFAKAFILVGIVGAVAGFAAEQWELVKENPTNATVIQVAHDFWKERFMTDDAKQKHTLQSVSDRLSMPQRSTSASHE